MYVFHLIPSTHIARVCCKDLVILPVQVKVVFLKFSYHLKAEAYMAGPIIPDFEPFEDFFDSVHHVQNASG